MQNKKSHTLSKEERLSWKRHIDLLFQEGQSFVAFPLRIVYLPVDRKEMSSVSMIVSVPKKKIKRAVTRNLIKRQVRETFRIRKHELAEKLTEKNKAMFVAFLYLENKAASFTDMEKAMSKAMKILKDKE